MGHQRMDLPVAVLHEYGNCTSQAPHGTSLPNRTQPQPTEGDVIMQPSLPRKLAGSLQDEEFILCHILPPERMSTAENPRVDHESFNPRYYVGDLWDLFFERK